MRIRRPPLLFQTTYWFFLTCILHILQNTLIYTQTSGKLAAYQEWNWILLAILLCQYSHQFCLIRGLLCRIYSSSRVTFNTWPFPFLTAQIFRFKLCQEYTTCLQYLQIPPSSPGTIFSLEWIWREEWGSVWQVEDEGGEPLGLRGGFDPTGLWRNGKRGLENWDILMWKALSPCHGGIPCDNKCKYSTMICIHTVTLKRQMICAWIDVAWVRKTAKLFSKSGKWRQKHCNIWQIGLCCQKLLQTKRYMIYIHLKR